MNMVKRKRRKWEKNVIKHHKLKIDATPNKPRRDVMWSGKIISSCSTRGKRHVTVVYKPEYVMNEEMTGLINTTNRSHAAIRLI